MLAALSEHAVAELVRLGLGAEVEPAFARACHEVTGGVPFLVKELVRAIAEEGIAPTAAAASGVAGARAARGLQSVVQRLNRLSSTARDLARAAAVLGEADLRLAAGLAGVDPGAATTAADELAAAGILDAGRPLRFVHPIVRAAVDADLSPGERAGLHAAAARRLADEGASAHRIAAHLLATDPAGDDWVVESLLGGRQDSDRERRSGLGRRLSAARAGGAALRAAGPRRPAQARVRRVVRGGPAGARLISRRRSMPPPSIRSGLDHARAGTDAPDRGPQSRGDGGVRPDARAPRQHRPTRGAHARGRRARRGAIRRRHRGRCRRADRPPAPAGRGIARRSLERVWHAGGRGCEWRTSPRRPSRASRSARLDGAPKLLPEAVDRPPFFYHACNALAFAERYEEARSRFDEALADARRLGSLPHVLGLSCYRGLLHLRIGNLADAEADARVALETGPRPPGIHAAVALAVLLETLAEPGS